MACELLRVEEIKTGCLYKLYPKTSDKLIGSFIVDVDGYLYFWEEPDLGRGCWSAHILREIADKLDALNKGWNDHINAYFEEQQKNQEIIDLGQDFL